MTNPLYIIIISPLVLILEFFFQLFSEITGNPGSAIIGLSFIVTIFCLPLYMIAEQWQETERQIQKRLAPGVARIKQTFKSDEQYMMLSAFYRENHYHPIMALRSSFSLFIQIPFFIAAYTYLSALDPLKGCSFLFLKSLGSPDATFHIGTFAINILPIAMTLINCVSGAVYSKGHPVSEKVQIYGCAAVFLILLYNSPAGLVVYWTMNNILSLVKNIFYKLKNPGKVLLILLCCTGIGFLFCAVTGFMTQNTIYRAGLALWGCLLPVLPLILHALSGWLNRRFLLLDSKSGMRLSLFVLSSIMLAFLAGITIPSFIMESEPELYCYIDNETSPFPFMMITFLKAAGFFIFWPACFYALFPAKIKKAFAVLFPVLACIALMNCFAFSGAYGPMNIDLRFMQEQNFIGSKVSILCNGIGIVCICVFLFFLFEKKTDICRSCCIVLLIALIGISAKNIRFVSNSFKNLAPPQIKGKIEPVYHLSKTGKNVIVIMLDRAVSPYIPVIMNERPDLKTIYDGFTYYPNTVSLGRCTMIGTPGIFGGYDYTPFEMNRRLDKTVREKHNEAILSMPVLFSSSGFKTVISDIPYENFSVQPVTEMYKPYPGIERIPVKGNYSDFWYQHHDVKKVMYLSTRIKRNFIWFSFFKMVSPVFRKIVYHNDYWLSYDPLSNLTSFINSYSSLEYLSELTAADADKNSFILMVNETVHEPLFLQAPDYIPVPNVTNYGSSRFAHNPQYHVMAGSLLAYRKFFTYLKQNGIYDNTKIIIVSDHGISENTGIFNNNMPFYKEDYIATLLVKDFNASGNMKTDMTFMTNADTPYLAAKDVIPDPVNPFTHNPLYTADKDARVKIDTGVLESVRIRDNKMHNIKDDEWYGVHGSIFNDKDWFQWNPDEIRKEK